jgi:hypothetical protein
MISVERIVAEDDEIADKYKAALVGHTGSPAPGEGLINVSENRGQIYSSEMIYRYVDTGPTIEAGSAIMPIHIRTENALGFAALHLAIHDFDFALECLQRAHALGRPDAKSIESKAFINAGVISYARAFASGVRGIRLDSDMFAKVWNEEDCELHEFLYALRDKHIAHSVNEFERCDPAGIIVFTPEGVLQEGISGAGVILQTRIGMPLQILEKAVHHIEQCITYLKNRINELRPQVHADMKADLPNGWSMVPMVTFGNDQNAVQKKRSTFRPFARIAAWLKQP